MKKPDSWENAAGSASIHDVPKRAGEANMAIFLAFQGRKKSAIRHAKRFY